MFEVKFPITNKLLHRNIITMMKRPARFALLPLLLALSASLAQAQNVATATSTAQQSGETVQFQSKLVGKTLPYNVYLPADYAAPVARTTRYPIIYLLHGLGGHYNTWSQAKLAEYATQFHLIIVTPEGNEGWYTDSATVPTDKYESYFFQELIPDTERRYRTLATREGRAVAGLSMGGYGALKFGIKHTDMFAFAASMSGALDAAVWTEKELQPTVGSYISRTIMQTFGAAESPTRAANDIYKMFGETTAASANKLPYFYLDCGTEDFLLQFSRRLDELFLTKKIAHEYRELPGAHNTRYWNKQLPEILSIAAQKLTPAANTAQTGKAAGR